MNSPIDVCLLGYSFLLMPFAGCLTHDGHLNVLKSIEFPIVEIVMIDEFNDILDESLKY